MYKKRTTKNVKVWAAEVYAGFCAGCAEAVGAGCPGAAGEEAVAGGAVVGVSGGFSGGWFWLVFERIWIFSAIGCRRSGGG